MDSPIKTPLLIGSFFVPFLENSQIYFSGSFFVSFSDKYVILN